MVSRVRAPTLGGSGIGQRSKRSTLSRLGSVASSTAQLTSVFARREEKAQRTARISATASLYEAMSEYDANPDTWGLNPQEKQDQFEAMRDKAVGALAERDREGAEALRLESATWTEKMLGDDRKQWQEKQASEAMDARAQVLDQARSDMRTATAGLFDRSDPKAPARAAALMGSVKSRFEAALTDLPPAVADAMRAEMNHEASRMAVDAWLSQAADPAAAWEMLRSNQDEWQLGDGTTFNLSGPLDDVAIEKAIDRDVARRSDQYTIETRQRASEKDAKERRTTRSVNTIKAAIYSGQMTVSGAREVVADKSTPPEVADAVDTWLDRYEARRGREAWLDPVQMRLQDDYVRQMDAGASPEALAQIRENVLSDDTLHPDLVPAVLRAGQARETQLARSEAAGTTRQTVSYAKDWAVWKNTARAHVQAVEGDRLTVVDTSPEMKAQVEMSLSSLERAGEQLLINSEGRAAAFLETIMPMAIAQSYEEALEGGGIGHVARPSARRWREFLANASSVESMKAISKMDGRAVVGFLQQAGLVGATTREHVQYEDDGVTIDPDATLLERERLDRVAGKVPLVPATYMAYARILAVMQDLPEAAAQATGKPFLDEDPHLMEVSP